MNDDNFQSLRNLISLKRHEQPDDAYFDELLDEFHRRQQQNHLQPSKQQEMLDVLASWFASNNRWNYVMGAGAAYALVFFAVIFFWPKSDVTPVLNTAPIQHEQAVESPMMENPVAEGETSDDKDKQDIKSELY